MTCLYATNTTMEDVEVAAYLLHTYCYDILSDAGTMLPGFMLQSADITFSG